MQQTADILANPKSGNRKAVFVLTHAVKLASAGGSSKYGGVFVQSESGEGAVSREGLGDSVANG
jgi:hypothetical protein